MPDPDNNLLTFGQSLKYKLPNSQLILRFSIVNLDQDVVPLTDEKPGNGVMPDIQVVQSRKDFLEQTDTQLNFAIDYVRKNNAN